MTWIAAGALGLLTLGLGISAATALAKFGLWLEEFCGGVVFWMGYFFAVVAPAFFGAFIAAGCIFCLVAGIA